MFRKIMVSDEVRRNVVFHRMVDIGRCSKCAYMTWKCQSVPPYLRHIWQNAFAKHHMLQIQQKKEYAKDRALAARDFPATELYIAMDGGSGYEFKLPHLSSADAEGPSKVRDAGQCLWHFPKKA